MSEGGKEVYPDDADVYSYLERGLLCPKCKEPVYLRQGDIRKPYFAHFHATSSRQVEECELRVSTDGNSTETSILIKDNGQRLEIFQQHFLSMITVGEEKIVDDVKFNNWINSIQINNNPVANNLIKDCTQYFLNHRRTIADKYTLPVSKIKDNQTTLQQQIALEAMDYLCVKSSLQLLEYVLYYSMYQLYKPKQDKLFKQQVTSNDIDTICHHTTRIILLNCWVEAIDSANSNVPLLTVNFSQEIETEIVKIKSQSPIQTFLADILSGNKGQSNKNINSSKINASQLSGSDRIKLKNSLPLHHSFTAYEYGAVSKKTGVRTEKPIMISCKVVTETYPTEDIAIQFTFMVNEYIKADSRMGVKNQDGKPVKSDVEIWHPARVYKFSNQFELSVDNYTDGLFPSDGYIENYPTYKTRADVAMLFETLLKHGDFQFIKTIEREDGSLYITTVYDPSILLLFELLEQCQIALVGSKYEPIEFTTILQSMINAANKALELGIPLINGMLLHSLYTAAKEQLKLSNNVNVLLPQDEHGMTGEHVYKKDGSYYNHLKPAKTQISSGSKLSSSVRKLIDTRLLSPIFTLPEFRYGVQLRVLENGNILLQEYQPTGLRTIGLVGLVTGIHYQRCSNQDVRVFDWSYYDGWKYQSATLERQVRSHLNKCNKDICYFLSKTSLPYEIDHEGNLTKAKKK